ncbi:MAG: antibiotic biosynthesis monooxygenase [Bacteroidia bacterium]|nr:antibiotic biosynthesis monooxygenase [Bacteroidia bacterium]
MILEVAILNIKDGKTKAFEQDFQKASPFIQNNPGYISHDLKRCMENDHQYILLVKWENLEDHEEGFRKSENYGPWKKLLHHYYDPFPVVEHYEAV